MGVLNFRVRGAQPSLTRVRMANSVFSSFAVTDRRIRLANIVFGSLRVAANAYYPDGYGYGTFRTTDTSSGWWLLGPFSRTGSSFLWITVEIRAQWQIPRNAVELDI